MADKGFKIVGVGEGGDKEKLGKIVVLASNNNIPKSWNCRIKTFDDDGILVYEFDCSSDAVAEVAFEYAMSDCGATNSEIMTDEGWEPFIG